MSVHRACLLIAVAASIAAAPPVHAHLRDYLFTIPYWTSPKGQYELEIYNDYRRTDSDQGVFLHQTEFEYGITDRLAAGVYAVLEKKGAGSFDYVRTKLETTYRLAESGRLPVDPALYLEYKIGAGDRDDEIEAKLILSKDFARTWNVTANAIFEKERSSGADWETGYTIGVSRWLSPKMTAGLELKGGEGTAYILPGAYLTLKPGVRLNIGPAFGITGKSDDFQIKSILEFEFF